MRLQAKSGKGLLLKIAPLEHAHSGAKVQGVSFQKGEETTLPM